MATFTLRRFSCPETLKAIAPVRFLAFLKPHRRFFLSRGVTLPQSATDGELDYEELARVFITPDGETPKELIDALYFVDEMATPEGMDALLAEAKQQKLKLAAGSDHSPADIAIQIWLLNSDILERKHAQHCMAKVRSFEYYQMDRFRRPAFTRPSDKQLKALASDLDDWFEEKKRGRGTRIVMGEKDDGVWFLVRHGDPYKREESIDGGMTSSVYYRPVKPDVVVYSPQVGELRINARSKGEKELYRTKFGEHLFGDKNIFPGTEKYTLDPLRALGEDSLALGDIDGIEWIKLREVQFFFGGNPWEIVTRKSEDVFAMFKSRNKSFPEGGRIIRATFQVKFSDAKTPRAVVIKPSNIAQFTRDDDSVLVERWLEARGFIINAGVEESDEPETLLASS
ncbi:MAG: hypothetical protein KatS3mg105_2237 [Gemmatales bacterium]|nr:MAG: hypothetical protein KatS3mg105_2237 [Gemmatales bacterium]